MAQVKEEVKVRPSNVFALADALRTAANHREKIIASKNRCIAEISTWTSEVLKHVEEVGEELLEEVEQVHAEAEESVVKEENKIRKDGLTSCTYKADFKLFKMVISPRLESLLFSGERLASLTDSPLLPSQLSLQLVTLPSQLLATVTCSVVATKGQPITKAVRSSLQLKVTSASGVDIVCREMVGDLESHLLFTFPAPLSKEGGYEVVAMLANLHLPGSPLIIPPYSQVETVASELGLLLQEKVDGKEFDQMRSAPELTETTSYQETRVKAEGDTSREVNKLSSVKQMLRKEVLKGKCQGQNQGQGKGQHQEQGVILIQEQMVKGRQVVDKSSQDNLVLKKVVKEKCPSQHVQQENEVQAVAQLRRPAFPRERTTDGANAHSDAEPESSFDHRGKTNDTGDLKPKSECASLAEQSKPQLQPIYNAMQMDPIKSVDQFYADPLETGIEKADKKMEVGAACYLLDEDTKMWHAGQIHNILNNLLVVKNLDSQKFNGYGKDRVVLNIEDIPQGALCADSAKKTCCNKEKGKKVQAGVRCVARWSQDLVWYRAEILTTTPTVINVRFIDYGNEADVRACDIVSAGWEVPAEDLFAGLVDSNVVLETEEEEEKSDDKDIGVLAEEPETRLDDETKVWSTGETCLARWEEDGVWYRAEVVEATSKKGSTRVLFVDYGNQDDATALVRTTAALGEDCIKDVHVDAAEDFPNQQTFEGVAKSAEAVIEESGKTEIKDVDISELACCVCGKLKKAMHRVQCDRAPVCWNCAVKKITSNKHTCWRCSASSISSSSHLVKDPVLDLCARDFLDNRKLNPADLEALRQSRMGTVGLDLCSLVTNGVLVAHKQLVIPARQPVGLAVAEEEVLVISQGNVQCFSRQGEARGHLISPQPLKHPSDILRLSSSGFAVAHAEGVAFFSQECKFLRNLDKVGGSCYGLAEDEEGHLLTISVNMDSKKAGLTEPGMTDVIYIDTSKDKVVKRIELVDVIQEEERMETKCRSLAYHSGKVFVGDIGKNRVFVLDNTMDVETIGETGNGRLQFKGPSCLVADSQGSVLVVDSHNHRIQLLNPDFTFGAKVKVDYPLARPTSIFLDNGNRQLWVANYLSNSVVIFGLF